MEDAPDFVYLSDRKHTARVYHMCSLCDRHINPGQRYRCQVFLEDGKFQLIKTHESMSLCPPRGRWPNV